MMLPGGPRVLRTSQLDRMAASVKSNLNPATTHRTIKALEKQGRLVKVTSGIFLNRLASPPAEPPEAADLIRKGALVSLLTVLGDAGITNNYTYQVWAVIPIGADLPFSQGKVETSVGLFRFHGINIDALYAPDQSDLFDKSVRYRRATPEAALCHWVYLSTRSRRSIRARLSELEMDDLDMARIGRISAAMGIENEMEQFLSQVGDLNDEQRVMPGLI